jgi:hypothetical protein
MFDDLEQFKSARMLCCLLEFTRDGLYGLGMDPL